MKKEIIITSEYSNERLDKILTKFFPEKTRTNIATMIDDGLIFVNSKIAKSSYKVKENDVIEVEIIEAKPLDVEGEDIPLDIVYEDEDIIVINKPQGMVVHPANGHYSGTLVNALLNHCKDLSGINGVARPGIVHRIDKDTSGLICVAKNDFAHQALAEQLKDHSMAREYYALVRGVIEENNGQIDLPIGRSKQDRKKMAVEKENGKPAITFFKVEKRFSEHTLVTCKLVTGRTHQIRVHMAYINHPVEGDPLYLKKASKIYENGQLLTAYRLRLIHPRTKKEMTFEVPLPDYFIDIINNLN
jgi:23S rRNA pseudouridine1911/1915/1917 synthase